MKLNNALFGLSLVISALAEGYVWEQDIRRTLDEFEAAFTSGDVRGMMTRIMADHFIYITPYQVIERQAKELSDRLEVQRIQGEFPRFGAPHMVTSCDNLAVSWQTMETYHGHALITNATGAAELKGHRSVVPYMGHQERRPLLRIQRPSGIVPRLKPGDVTPSF